MKSQVLHTVWGYFAGEAVGKNLELITVGSERINEREDELTLPQCLVLNRNPNISNLLLGRLLVVARSSVAWILAALQFFPRLLRSSVG